MKVLSIAFTAVMIGALAGPSNAATSSTEIRKKEVTFADLDIARDEGAAALYRRIKAAAEEVCEQPMLPRLARVMHEGNCVAQATVSAVEYVNTPLLTRYQRTLRNSGRIALASEAAFVQEMAARKAARRGE